MNTKKTKKIQIISLYILVLFSSSCANFYIMDNSLLDKPVISVQKPKVNNISHKLKSVKIDGYKASKEQVYKSVLKSSIPVFVEGEDSIDVLIDILMQAGSEHGVDPILLFSLAIKGSGVDSGFREKTRYGIIPLSVEKARFISDLYSIPFSLKGELYNPQKNITLFAAGIRFFQELFEGDIKQSLMAFHWDVDSVVEYASNNDSYPSEHVNYILDIYGIYTKLYKQGYQLEIEEVKTPEQVRDHALEIKADYILEGDHLYKESKLKSFIAYLMRYAEKDKSIRRKRASLLIKESKRKAYDPLFVTALVNLESSFNEKAVGIDNKIGYMQINPEEGQYLASITKNEWDSPDSLYNPGYNMKLGLDILSLSHKIFENKAFHSLVGYNLGIKKLINALKSNAAIPQTSVEYPSKVIKLFHSLKSQYGKYDESVALKEEKEADLQEEIINKIKEKRSKEEDIRKSKLIAIEKIKEKKEPSLIVKERSEGMSKVAADRLEQARKEEIANETPKEKEVRELIAKQKEQLKKRREEIKSRQDNLISIIKNEQSDSSDVNVKVINPPSLRGKDEKVEYFVCSSLSSKKKCRALARKFNYYARNYEVDPILLSLLAMHRSGFDVKYKSNDGRNVGLFQFKLTDMEKVSYNAKVAWAGEKNLLTADYSLRVASKYIRYLQRRYKNKAKYVVLGFIWDPELVSKTARAKQKFPSDVSILANKILSSYSRFK